MYLKIAIGFGILMCSLSSYSQAWQQKSNFAGAARHRATAFSIGNKGYLGLGHINSATDILYDDLWEYDPASDSWTQKANYPYLVYHATGFAIGSKGYIGTGRKEDNSYTTDFFEYNPVTNTWTAIANFPGFSRRGAVSFVVNDIAYVGTGQVGGSIYSSDFYAYNPTTDSWSSIPSLPGSDRTSSVAFSIGSIGYVGTGNVGGGTNDFYAYDPNSNTWTQKADVGTISRQEATGFAVNGKGYIGTGDNFSSGTNYGDMWEYIPSTDTWKQIGDFAGVPRRYLTAMVINNIAYVGTGTSGTNFSDFWRFDYDLSLDEATKENNLIVNTYPNPAIDMISFEFKEISEYQITIYSIDGKHINTLYSSGETISIYSNNLKSGVYFYSVQQNKIEILTDKFIFK